MNESISEQVDAIVTRWAASSSLLRVMAGVDGLGFDSVCRISRVSASQIDFSWEGGIGFISLPPTSIGLADPSDVSTENFFSSTEEYVCQLQLTWPSGAKAIISELRLPS